MANDLVKSGDVHGKHLVGLGGARLGSVREMYLDLTSGKVAFIIVETANLLGGSGKFHPVPWSAVNYDGAEESFRLQMTKDKFKVAPSYDRDQLANANYGWHEQATRYFSTATAEDDS